MDASTLTWNSRGPGDGLENILASSAEIRKCCWVKTLKEHFSRSWRHLLVGESLPRAIKGTKQSKVTQRISYLLFHSYQITKLAGQECLFHLMTYLQHLEEWLAYRRCSITIYPVNKYEHFLGSPFMYSTDVHNGASMQRPLSPNYQSPRLRPVAGKLTIILTARNILREGQFIWVQGLREYRPLC